MNTKNKKKTNLITPKASKMAMFSLFCAAAGVYAADTDGWKYKDDTKTVIENTGTGNITRTTAIEKHGTFDDNTAIEGVSKVEMASGAAKFAQDDSSTSTSLKGVVFDGADNSLTMASGANLSVDSSATVGGSATTGIDATGVQFSSEATSATIAGEGDITVKASGNATAVDGTNLGDIDAKTISAESVNGNATGIKGTNVGNVTVGDLSAVAANGNATALDVNGNAGDVKITTATGNVNINGTVNSLDVVTTNGDITLGTVADTTTLGTAGNVTIEDAKSTVFITNTAGDVKITTAGSAVDVDGNLKSVDVDGTVNSLDITTATGGVYVDNVQNELKIGAAEDVVDVDGTVGGSLNITTAGGEVDVGTVAGTTTIGTATGNVTIDNASDDVSITTAGGNVTLGIAGNVTIEDAKSTVFITNTAGDVKITTAGSAVDVDGNLKSVDVDGTVNSLDITTATGGVYVDNVQNELKIGAAEDVVDVDGTVGSLNITTAGGEVDVGTVKGATTIGTANGDVTLGTAGNVTVGDIAVEKTLSVTTSAKDVVVSGEGNANIAKADSVTVEDGKSLGGTLTVGEAVNVDVSTVAGTTTIGTATGNVTIDNAADVTITEVKGATTITTANGNVKLGTAGNVTVGDIAVEKTLSVTTSAKDVVVSGEGNANIAKADSVTVEDGKSLGGTLTVGEAVNVDVSTVEGTTTITKATGNVTIDNAADVTITEVAGTTTIGTASGDVTISKNEDIVNVTEVTGTFKAENAEGALDVDSAGAIDANLNNSSLIAGTVENDTKVNGTGNVDVVETKSLTIGNLTGNVEVDKLISADITTVDGNVKVENNIGKVEVDDVKDFEASKAQGDVEIGNADSVIVNLDSAKLTTTGVIDGDTAVNGTGNVEIANTESLTINSLKGAVTVGELETATVTKLEGSLEIGKNTDEVNVTEITGGLTASEAQGDIIVGSAGALDVNLENGDLKATTVVGESEIKGTGNVEITTAEQNVNIDNLDGDAKISTNKGELNVETIDKLTALNAEGDVTVTTAKNIEATLNGGDLTVKGDVTTNLKVSGVGDVTLENNTGTVNVGTLDGDFVASNAQANIGIESATSVEVKLQNNATLDATNVTEDVSVSGRGSAKIGTAENITVSGGLTGNLNVTTTVKKVTADNVDGNVTIQENTGDVDIETVGGSLITYGAKDDVKVGSAKDITIYNGLDGNLNVTTTVGKVTADSITKDANIEKNTNVVNIGKIDGTLTAKNAEGDIIVGTAGGIDLNLVNNKNATVDTVKGESIVNGTGNLTINGVAKGDVTIDKLTGDVVVASSEKGIKVTELNGSLTASDAQGDVTVEKSASSVDVKLNKADLITKDAIVNGNVAVSGEGNANLGTVGGVTGALDGNLDVANATGIVDMDSVTGNVTITTANATVDIDSVGEKLTVSDANANVTVGSAGSVDVKLNNNVVLDVENVGAVNIQKDSEGSVDIGNASSLTAATIDGNFVMKGQDVNIDGTKLDIDIANLKEGGSITTGNLSSVDIKTTPVGEDVSTVKVGDVSGTVEVRDSTVNLEAGDVSGAVKLTSLSGNAKFEKTESDVVIGGTSMVGDLDITTAEGTIKANSFVEGNITVGTAEKDVTIAEIKGDVDITTAEGLVTVNGATDGDITVGTAGMGIDVADVTGSVKITTAKGEIQAGNIGKDLTIGDAQANVNVGNIGGNANVTFSNNSSMDADNITGDATIKLAGGTFTANDVGGKADVSGFGKVDLTVEELSGFVGKDVKIDGDNNQLKTVGDQTKDLVSDITVNSGKFGITSADSITATGNLEGSLSAETVKGAVTISAITKDSTAATDTVIDLGTVEGATTITTANGDVKIGIGADVTVTDANGDVTLGTAGNVTVGDIAVEKTLSVTKSAKDVVVSGEGNANIAKADSVTVEDGKSLGGTLTVGEAVNVDVSTVKGATTITTANGYVEIDNASDVSITTANGDVKIGTGADVTVTDANGNVTLGNVSQVVVTEAGKSVTITTADSLEFGKIKENLTVDTTINSINAATGTVKNVEIAENTGSVKIGTVENKLTLENVRGGDSVIGSAKEVEATVRDGTLKVVEVEDSAVVTAKGGTSIFTAIKNKLTAILAGGDVEVNEDVLDAKVSGAEGKVTFGASINGTLDANELKDANIELKNGSVLTANIGGIAGNVEIATVGTLNANVNGVNIDIEKVKKDANISGTKGTVNIIGTVTNLNTLEEFAGATVDVGTATNAVLKGTGTVTIEKLGTKAEIATANGEKLVIDNDSARTEGALNSTIKEFEGTSLMYRKIISSVDVDTTKKVNSLSIAEVSNGGTIDGITVTNGINIDKVSGAETLTVGSESQVVASSFNIEENTAKVDILNINGNVTLDKAKADVKIGKIDGDILVNLFNANLNSTDDSNVTGIATVNGGCDATFQDVHEIIVNKGLNGTLTVNGKVDTANLVNVTGGFHVNNATGSIVVTETNINVINGGEVKGITSNSDLTLSNQTGSATLGGVVDVTGDLNVASNGFVIADTNTPAGAVIKANNLTGDGAKDLVHNYYNGKYGLTATDQSVIKTETLVGVHDVATAGSIDAALAQDLAVTSNYVDVAYTNKANDGTTGTKINYEITRNSYLEDVVAQSANEKAIARVYDNLEFQNDAAKDAESVAKKLAIANGGTAGLKAILPQAVVRSARLNMDLADVVHLDTIYRTGATRDMLNAYGKPLNKYVAAPGQLVRGTTYVSVRNINRFASYSGDRNISGSDDYIYGALANVECIADENLFFGAGLGGFNAESDGKDSSGKAETQSITLNLYADYAFLPNFDWYVGFTYSFGMNEVDRKNLIDESKADWDSNMVGIFTGVRYSWKPYADKPLYIKPIIGVNANFLMNPSFDEKSGAEKLSVDSENYVSVKSVIGVEATYRFLNGFDVAGRMLYTHEFGDDSYDANAMFLNMPSSRFRVKGWEMDRDAGIFGIGLGYAINDFWRVYLDYAAEVSSDLYHNLNAGVQMKF